MAFDIFIGIIVIFTMAQGFRNGFVYTFIHMIGWLLSVILGFVWSPYVRDFLLEKTDFYDFLYKNVDGKFTDTLANAEISFNNLPEILSKKLDVFAGNAASAMAESFSSLLFTIISFLIVVILVKLALWLIIGALSKRHNQGFTGILDGMMGLIFGFMKGMIFIFILLAVLVPLLSLVSDSFAREVMTSLNASYFAKDLYDNNLILLIARDFLT